MNPQTPNQDDPQFDSTPLDTTGAAPTQEVPATTPEADAAALQAIEALEAEESPISELSDSTSPDVGEKIAVTSAPPLAQQAPAPVQTSSPNPFSTFGGSSAADDTAGAFIGSQPASPSNEASPALGAVMASSLKDAPSPVTSSDPFGPKKKSKKGLIIAIVLVLVLAGGSVAGYFVWQSLQAPAATPETTETQQGDQPGDVNEEDQADPTAESVENEASSLETEINGFDTSELNDTTLNDATLYQN